MALTYDEKIKHRDTLIRLRQMELGEDADALLDLVMPMIALTDAEAFTYTKVLPAMPEGEWVCAADIVETLGLGVSSRRSVSSALSRLVKEGHAESRKETSDIVTMYVKTYKEA